MARMHNLFMIVQKKVIYSFICPFRKYSPSPYPDRGRIKHSVSIGANLEPDLRNFSNPPWENLSKTKPCIIHSADVY